VLTQLNGGPGKARNNGLMHSEGEYIAFVDSDNFIDYGFVEKVLNKAYEQNYDIVKVGYKKIKEGIISEHLYKDECYVNDFSFALKYDGFLWGAVYKREFFKKILLPEQIAFEDMIVRLTLYRKANTFCYISESLYYYNDYSTNTTNGVSKTNFNRLDHLCLLEVILRDNEKIGIPLDDIEKSLILSELGFMFWYRIAHLPLNVKECAFIYASHNIIDKYIADIERSKFSRIERQIYDCYKNRDFNKWLIIGRMH